MTIASGLKYMYIYMYNIYSIIILFQNGMVYLVKSPQTVAFAVQLTSDKSETIYTILKVRHHIK